MCTGPRDGLRDRLRNRDGLTARDLLDVEDTLRRQARGETITAAEARLIARVIEEDPYGYQRARAAGERAPRRMPVYATTLDVEGNPDAQGWREVGSLPAPDGVRYRYDEYDFYEVDADGNIPQTLVVNGEIVEDAPAGPAAAHLSSDSSRSAYAAAGALRDAGDARDDDLAWPDDWSWGRPAPMLSDAPDGYDGTHSPVYAPGTLPAPYIADDADDRDDDDDDPYPGAFAACPCPSCAYARALDVITLVGGSIDSMTPAIERASAGWTSVVEQMAAALGVPRAMVAGTIADPLRGGMTGRPTGILTASTPDDPYPVRSVAEWTREGMRTVSVVFDETANYSIAGDWSMLVDYTVGPVLPGALWDACVEPPPLLVSASEAAGQAEPLAPEFRLDRIRRVDTVPNVTIAVDLDTRDARLVGALRNGEVVEVTNRGWRNIAHAVYTPQVYRAGRLVTGSIA